MNAIRLPSGDQVAWPSSRLCQPPLVRAVCVHQPDLIRRLTELVARLLPAPQWPPGSTAPRPDRPEGEPPAADRAGVCFGLRVSFNGTSVRAGAPVRERRNRSGDLAGTVARVSGTPAVIAIPADAGWPPRAHSALVGGRGSSRREHEGDPPPARPAARAVSRGATSCATSRRCRSGLSAASRSSRRRWTSTR